MLLRPDGVQVLARLPQGGLQRERLLVVLDRAREVSAIRVEIGEIVVRLRELGIDLQGALVVRFGLAPAVERHQGIAEVVERRGEVRSQADRLLELGNRLGRFSLVEESKPRLLCAGA